jgi:SnoaL-like domain
LLAQEHSIEGTTVTDPGSSTSLLVSDQLALHGLIAKLCQSLDFSRPDEFASLFTPDGVYEAVTSEAKGRQLRFRHAGAGELLDFAKAAAEKRKGLGRHWTGNVVLAPVPGEPDSATAVSYVLFVEVSAETGDRRILISGVHEDSFTRTAEGWRFARRRIVADL